MDRVWLTNYPSSIPPDINAEVYSSLADFFEQVCEKYSKQNAFSNFGVDLTYSTLQNRVKSLAAYFQNVLQLAPGTRIALMLPNLLQYPIALCAALKAGMVVVNVNPLYTADELKHQLNDAGAEVIIVLENFAHTVAAVYNQTPLKHVLITTMGDELGLIKGRLMNFVVKYIKQMVVPWEIAGAKTYKQAIAAGQKLNFSPPSIKLEDTAFLQYTGGTTGVAKGAILSHKNILANIQQLLAWMKPYLTEGQEIMITALPLYHIFSLTVNCMTFFGFGALNLLITNPRDISSMISMVSKFNFTCMTGVNTLFNGLLNHPKFSTLNFDSFHLTIGGGMAVQPSVAKRWKETTGTEIIEGYGLSETSPVVSVNFPDIETYNGTIGVPLPSTFISIQNEQEDILPFGEIGEICIKGPQVMEHYWNNPEETHRAFTSTGWFRSGDVGTMDFKGYIKIVDRKKDMIIISGFNVYPNEVEGVLTQQPGILEAAVIGVEDANANEQVKAFIVRNDPHLDEKAIIEYCRQHLTAYKIPKIIEFCEELPKTPVGKILRRRLR